MTRTDDLSKQGLALPVPVLRLRKRYVALWLLVFWYVGIPAAITVYESQQVGLSILAVTTCIAWAIWGGRPVLMARDYLYAQQHVPVEVRGQATRIPDRMTGLSVPALLLLLALVRMKWGERAPVGACALGVALLLVQPRTVWRALRAWALSFAYPRTVNAGVWNPHDQQRRWFFISLALLWTLTSSSLLVFKGQGTLPATPLAVLVVLGLAHIPACRALNRIELQLAGLQGAGKPPTLDVLHGRVQRAGPSRCDGVPFEQSEHLLLGTRVSAFDRREAPVFLQLSHLQHHMYISGGPGSCKTNLTSGIVSQAMRIGERTGDRPVVIFIDMKGDHASAQTIKEEAERSGYVYKLFSLDSSMETERFNPLEQFCWSPREPALVRSQLMSILHLVHGDEHGTRYFATQSRMKLQDGTTLDDASLNWDALENFSSLYRSVLKKDSKGTTELTGVLQELADYKQLHTERSWHGVPRISIEEVLEESHVVYAWLQPTADGASGVKEVARMLLHAVLDEANKRARCRKPQRAVYVVMDEFQQALSQGLAVFLEQARSFGIRMILANQTRAALRTGKYTDLSTAVQANTGTKVMFTVDDTPTFTEVMARSGEQTVAVGSRPMIRPRLTADQINFVSNTQGAFLLSVRGCSSPVVAGDYYTVGQIIYPISKEEYARRSTTPLQASGVKYPPARRPGEAVGQLSLDNITPAENPPAIPEPTPVTVPHERLGDLAASIRSSLGLTQVARA